MIPLVRYARTRRITPASANAFPQAVDQDVVMHPVEELFQINIHYDAPTRLHIRCAV